MRFCFWKNSCNSLSSATVCTCKNFVGNLYTNVLFRRFETGSTWIIQQQVYITRYDYKSAKVCTYFAKRLKNHCPANLKATQNISISCLATSQVTSFSAELSSNYFHLVQCLVSSSPHHHPNQLQLCKHRSIVCKTKLLPRNMTSVHRHHQDYWAKLHKPDVWFCFHRTLIHSLQSFTKCLFFVLPLIDPVLAELNVMKNDRPNIGSTQYDEEHSSLQDTCIVRSLMTCSLCNAACHAWVESRNLSRPPSYQDPPRSLLCLFLLFVQRKTKPSAIFFQDVRFFCSKLKLRQKSGSILGKVCLFEVLFQTIACPLLLCRCCFQSGQSVRFLILLLLHIFCFLWSFYKFWKNFVQHWRCLAKQKNLKPEKKCWFYDKFRFYCLSHSRRYSAM